MITAPALCARQHLLCRALTPPVQKLFFPTASNFTASTRRRSVLLFSSQSQPNQPLKRLSPHRLCNHSIYVTRSSSLCSVQKRHIPKAIHSQQLAYDTSSGLAYLSSAWVSRQRHHHLYSVKRLGFLSIGVPSQPAQTIPPHAVHSGLQCTAT